MVYCGNYNRSLSGLIITGLYRCLNLGLNIIIVIYFFKVTISSSSSPLSPNSGTPTTSDTRSTVAFRRLVGHRHPARHRRGTITGSGTGTEIGEGIASDMEHHRQERITGPRQQMARIWPIGIRWRGQAGPGRTASTWNIDELNTREGHRLRPTRNCHWRR